MKFTIASTLVILALGTASGLLLQRQGVALAQQKLQLAAQAAQLGISPAGGDLLVKNQGPKRQREPQPVRHPGFAAALVTFAKQLEAHEKAGAAPDPVFDKRSLELKTQLMNLGAAELKDVIANLREDTTLSAEVRSNLISFAILLLGEDHPAAALALLAESSDLLADPVMGLQVIHSSLITWARQDPAAALAWIAKHAGDHPETTADELKQNLISGLAETDPQLAFKLIGEIGLEDPAGALLDLAENCQDPHQRTAMLTALRAHLATLPAGEERDSLLEDALSNMGRNLVHEKFDSVTAWISAAKLTPAETVQFAAGLSYFNTQQDTGRWIDWMALNLPQDAVREQVDNLVGQWTQQDFLAAGKWLSGAPAGDAKNTAVSTYAGTVAEYEPQVAVQWALTLPAGPERKSTLERIYQNWPKKDTAGAKLFAKQHGLDPQKSAQKGIVIED